MRRREWSEDVQRIQHIAVAAACDGFTCSPQEVIEMLCIIARHNESSRDELIRFAAEAVYPFTDGGDRAIAKFIEQAKKGRAT